MYAISLGDDRTEPRLLEPWHAAEFLAHLDRGRGFITEHIPFGASATDPTRPGRPAVVRRQARR